MQIRPSNRIGGCRRTRESITRKAKTFTLNSLGVCLLVQGESMSNQVHFADVAKIGHLKDYHQMRRNHLKS